MPIEPDTKNWTWVLDHACVDCGFDASTVDYGAIPKLLRDNAQSWAAVLDRPDVRQRPDESTWSPLEYAAHVRDADLLFRERLTLMLAEVDPPFADWDQDATAVEGDYNAQDPAVVGKDLVAAEPGVVATARRSLSNRSPGTSSTIRSIICTTSISRTRSSFCRSVVTVTS